MESENVAVVRRIFDLFNRLDTDPEVRRRSPVLEELMSLYDPEVEFSQPVIQPDADTTHGESAFRKSWEGWLGMWEEHRSHLVEITERGDSVLALTRNTFRGRDGIELEQDVGVIFTLANGRVTHQRSFYDFDQGRAAFAREAEA